MSDLDQMLSGFHVRVILAVKSTSTNTGESLPRISNKDIEDT